MKKYLLIVLSLIALLKTGIAQPNASVPTADQTVKNFCDALMASFNGGDVERALALASTNLVITWQNNEVSESPTAIKAHIQKMTKGDHPLLNKITADSKVVGRHAEGDCAILWGELNDHFILTDGRDLPLNGHFTTTVINRGDGWRVSAFHVSVDAFSNPITEMAVKKIALVAGIGGIITGTIVGLVIASLLRRPKSSP